jgi:hypothetical protein
MTLSEAHALAERIVDDLFVTGHGAKADRLVLMTADGRNLGGWGRKPAMDRIIVALTAEQQQ